MNRREFLKYLSMLAMPALAGCTTDDPALQVNLSKRLPIVAAKSEKAITYAYLPQYSHAVSFKRHRKLLEYLRRRTGLPLKQIFPDTFQEHVNMVARGRIDISFSNPIVYIRLAQEGAFAFARTVELSGEPFFRGQIICRKDNPTIRKLEDVRGKSWIAVDPKSAGGYIFPLGYFLEHGIHKDDFSTIEFAPGPGGKQEKVVLAVNAGAYDIGTIRKGTLDVVAEKTDIEQIRVLGETRPYPGWVYAARKDLDPAIVKAIGQAMFHLNPQIPAEAEILKNAEIQRIIPARDEDYDPVRALAKELALDGLNEE